MKPDYDSKIVTSTLEGEVIEYSFSEKDLPHLMGMMIDLYKYPERAVLREYATNALDAHKAIGQTRPIEVQLPNLLDPTLTIQDFGPGLSLQDMREVYTKYGASTKRESNEVTGMLGVGSKSALTYTDQFTIRSVKDGARSMLAVSRNAEGAASMMVVEKETPTDEHSGVKIIVPVRKENSFATEAYNLFRFWEPGTVLVDGEQPKRFKGDEVAPGVFFMQEDDGSYHGSYDVSYIVMGNVPYPVTASEIGLNFTSQRHYQGMRYSVVAYVPMGAVNFMSSRESLDLTTKTKAKLESISTNFVQHLLDSVRARIDAAAIKHEALAIYEKERARLPREIAPKLSAEYRGEVMPSRWETPTETVPAAQGPPHWGSREKGGALMSSLAPTANPARRFTRHATIEAHQAVNKLWFYNFPFNNLSPVHYRKLERFLLQRFTEVEAYVGIFTRDKPDTTWLNEDHVIDWTLVQQQKLPSAAVEKPKQSYDVAHSYGTRRLTKDQIPADKPIFYYLGDKRGSRYSKDRYSRAKPWINAAQQLISDPTVVLIPDSREKGLLKFFPNAQKIETYVTAQHESWTKRNATTRATLISHTWGGGQRSHLRKLPASKVDDPAIRKVVLEAQRTVDKRDVDLFDCFIACQLETRVDESPDPLARYPLFGYSRYGDEQLDHLVIYLNAAYNTLYKEQS